MGDLSGYSSSQILMVGPPIWITSTGTFLDLAKATIYKRTQSYGVFLSQNNIYFLPLIVLPSKLYSQYRYNTFQNYRPQGTKMAQNHLGSVACIRRLLYEAPFDPRFAHVESSIGQQRRYIDYIIDISRTTSYQKYPLLPMTISTDLLYP